VVDNFFVSSVSNSIQSVFIGVYQWLIHFFIGFIGYFYDYLFPSFISVFFIICVFLRSSAVDFY